MRAGQAVLFLVSGLDRNIKTLGMNWVGAFLGFFVHVRLTTPSGDEILRSYNAWNELSGSQHAGY
jgi:hypothetical protein